MTTDLSIARQQITDLLDVSETIKRDFFIVLLNSYGRTLLVSEVPSRIDVSHAGIRIDVILRDGKKVSSTMRNTADLHEFFRKIG